MEVAVHYCVPDDPFPLDDFCPFDSRDQPPPDEFELTEGEFIHAVLYAGNLYAQPPATLGAAA